MVKRIIAGTLGTLAVFGSLLPLGYTLEIFKDFGNPNISFWPNVLGVLLMCSIGLAGMGIGIRFLLFASSGRSQQSDSWVKPILLGIGFFFPGFVFSLPLTILWAARTWPGDDVKIERTFEVSACVGVAAAVACTILLLRKRGLRHTS